MSAYLSLSSTTTETTTAVKVTIKLYYHGNGVSYSGYQCKWTINFNGDSKSGTNTFTTSTSAQFLGSATFTVSKTSSSQSLKPSASFVTGVSLKTMTKTGSAITIPAKTTTYYTLSYDSNGGSTAPESQTVAAGTSVTLSSISPTRTGYDFTGWSNGSNTYQPGASYTVNGNVTLTAQWSAASYTITFYKNDSTSVNEPHSVAKGSSIILSTIWTRTDYIFLGWSESASATTASYSAYTSFTPTSDKTFYAVWRYDDSISVYYYGYNDTYYAGRSITKGSTASQLSLPTKYGYTCLGWRNWNDRTKAFNFNQALYSNTSIASAWSPQQVTLYFNWGLSETPLVETDHYYNETYGKYNESQGEYLLPMPWDYQIDYSGYNFDGWMKGNNYISGSDIINETGEITLTAHWTKKSYSLNFKNDDIVIKSIGIDYNEECTNFPSVKKTGYSLDGWYFENTEIKFPEGSKFTYNESKVLVAKWIPQSATLIIDWNWSDNNNIPPEWVRIIRAENQKYGEAINWNSGSSKLTLPERPGYKLLGLNQSKTATTAEKKWGVYTEIWDYLNPNNITTAEKTLYAIWELDYNSEYNRTGSIDKNSNCIFRRTAVNDALTSLEIAVPVKSGIIQSYTDRSLHNYFKLQTFLAITVGLQNLDDNKIYYYTGPILKNPTDKNIKDNYCITIPITNSQGALDLSTQTYKFILNQLGSTTINSSITNDNINISATGEITNNPNLDNWTSELIPSEAPVFSYNNYYFVRVYCYTNVYKISNNTSTYFRTLPIESLDNFISQEYIAVDISAEGREIAIGGTASDNHEGLLYNLATTGYNSLTRYYELTDDSTYQLLNNIDETEYARLLAKGNIYTVGTLPDEAHLALYGYVDCGNWY